MGHERHGVDLDTQTSLQEYFQQSIDESLNAHHTPAEPDTVYYVVSLLTAFQRAENLYENTEDGLSLRPLALLYGDAVNSPSSEESNKALRRLGDVALFISGMYQNSLNRKVVDVDYYITMGGSAYGCLSDRLRGTFKGNVFSDIFAELGGKFGAFVDALCDLREQASAKNDLDILRTYEVWLRTGSKRAAALLRGAGIHPDEASTSRLHH